MARHEIIAQRSVNGLEITAYHHTSAIADYYGVDVWNPITAELVAAYELNSAAEALEQYAEEVKKHE